MLTDIPHTELQMLGDIPYAELQMLTHVTQNEVQMLTDIQHTFLHCMPDGDTLSHFDKSNNSMTWNIQ